MVPEDRPNGADGGEKTSFIPARCKLKNENFLWAFRVQWLFRKSVPENDSHKNLILRDFGRTDKEQKDRCWFFRVFGKRK
jgi:hypothetical protein